MIGHAYVKYYKDSILHEIGDKQHLTKALGYGGTGGTLLPQSPKYYAHGILHEIGDKQRSTKVLGDGRAVPSHRCRENIIQIVYETGDKQRLTRVLGNGAAGLSYRSRRRTTTQFSI